MLKIADRYLLSQLLLSVIFGIVLFSIIWLAPETLFKLIQNISNGTLTLAQGTRMFLYNVPAVLPQSIPMAALIGSLFLFRRLSLNTEWIAMLSSGISPVRLMLPVALIGVLLSGLHSWIQESVLPHTSPQLQNMARQAGLDKHKTGNFVFVERTPSGQLSKFILIGDTRPKTVLPDTYKNIIVLFYRHPKNTSPLPAQEVLHHGPLPKGEGAGGTSIQIERIVRAETVTWDDAKSLWHLHKGVDYVLDEKGVYKTSLPFVHQAISTSPTVAQLVHSSQEVPLDMSSSRLAGYISQLEAGGQLQNLRFYQVRLAQKAVFPLAALCFTVLGALLGLSPARSSKNMGLTMGALVLFTYSILIPLSSQLGSLGLLAPVVAAWIPLGLASLLGVILLGIKTRLRA